MTTNDTAACRRVSKLAKLYAIHDVAARTDNEAKMLTICRMVHATISEMIEAQGPEATAEHIMDARRRANGNTYHAV